MSEKSYQNGYRDALRDAGVTADKHTVRGGTYEVLRDDIDVIRHRLGNASAVLTAAKAGVKASPENAGFVVSMLEIADELVNDAIGDLLYAGIEEFK